MWQLFSPVHPSSQRTKFFFEDILLDTDCGKGLLQLLSQREKGNG